MDILHSRVIYKREWNGCRSPFFMHGESIYMGPESGEAWEMFLDSLRETKGEAIMTFVWERGREVGVLRVNEGEVKVVDLNMLLTGEMLGDVRRELSWPFLR